VSEWLDGVEVPQKGAILGLSGPLENIWFWESLLRFEVFRQNVLITCYRRRCCCTFVSN